MVLMLTSMEVKELGGVADANDDVWTCVVHMA